MQVIVTAMNEKAGFTHEGRMRGMMLREGRRWDYLFMGILREEWQQKEGDLA